MANELTMETLVSLCKRRGFVYQSSEIYGGLSFYSRKEIKDLLSYFRIVINQNDEGALQRIINVPARGIGKTTIEKIVVAADNQNVNIWKVINNPTGYGVNINLGTQKKY